MPDPGPEEQAARHDPIPDAAEDAPASGAAERCHTNGAIRTSGAAQARGDAGSRRAAQARGEAESRRAAQARGEAESRRATHGRAGDVAIVVKVSPAFEAAIRAVAREAAADNTRTDASLGCEAAFEQVHAKVRAAARELIRADARVPLWSYARRGFR